MSDAELIARLRDAKRDWPEFGHDRAEAADRIEAQAAEIERLVREKKWIMEERDRTFALVLARAEMAEAKLAKAVEALEAFKEFDDLPTAVKRPDLFEIKVRRTILRTLAELKGQDDEWKCPINYTGCTKNCGSYGCGN